MFIAHSRPASMTVSVAGSSAGAALLTPGVDMINGRPADPTRLQWLPAGSPAITDYVEIHFDWTDALVPGLLGLIGLNVLGLASSAGFKMNFNGRRASDTAGTYPYNLGGNTLGQRSIQRDDNSVATLGMTATGLTALVGAKVRIYNDQNGVATIAPSQVVDLGDFWCSPGFDLDVDGDWDIDLPDSNEVPGSTNEQPWPWPYPPGRVLTFKRSGREYADTFLSGATPAWQALRTLCGNGKTSIFIPRWFDIPTQTLDVASMHATAIMGTAKFAKIARTGGGDKYSFGATVKETPALLAE